MDNEHEKLLQQLIIQMVDASDMVTAYKSAQAEGVRSEVDIHDCQNAVDQVVAEYQRILEQVPQKDRPRVERRYGRKVADLRAMAGGWKAPTKKKPVPLATGNQWTIHTPPPEPEPAPLPAAELPPPGEQAPRRRRGRPTGPHVGGELEAWCGSCKEMREHTIVAMVGKEPKQVLCNACGARHGFRLTPARGRKPAAEAASTLRKTAKQSRATQEQKRQEAAQTALQKELTEAENVRPFNRRTRYRAGDIIEHPEHGRGKVESVIKGSILVRFRAGLRPISLY